MKKIWGGFILTVLVLGGCRERYDPPVRSVATSYLVVEGVLNVSSDSTKIRLTRTFGLDQQSVPRIVSQAFVSVEGEDNSIANLVGDGSGYYMSPNLGLIPGTRYRLRIQTSDGEYLSDYVTAKITPPIDSIGWDRTGAGLQIYANSEDPAGNTKYYRWDYEETWEIRSASYSFYVYDGGIVVRQRQLPQEDVYFCWKYNNSSEIVIGNTTRLQLDSIYKGPIRFIPAGDERLSERYSILVREYAMEQGAYDFYELMKKNTENIGSLFNPQPSEIRGNIHSTTNPDEYVIGYVQASTINSKRIFIDRLQVPDWGFSMDCFERHVSNYPDSILKYFGTYEFIPTTFHTPPGDYYVAAPARCADCRIRGGSTGRPSYW